jgi:hypothetical protein
MTVTTHESARLMQPMPLSYAAPPSALAQKRIRLGDRYFSALSLVLLGYALAGRGFAYLGVPPLFIGEIMLLVGVFVLFKIGVLGKLLNIPAFIPLMMFMFWGLCRTVPYFDKYGKDTIRDAVIWGYGTYAFIVAGLLISNPLRVQKLVINYRKFVFWFLLLCPVTTMVWDTCYTFLPQWPISGVPIIEVKGGDMSVHLAGCFAYIVALGSSLPVWLAPIFVPINLGLNLQGRAGMVSFFMAVAICMTLRPFHPRAMRIFFVLGVVLFLAWASDLRIKKDYREISITQMVKDVTSIAGSSDDEAMEGTKEWRMKWWSDIIDYTFHGQYFWTGKGYGINLATDDGYQVEADDALRSPHSGHMTMLARGGVPNFFIWIFMQIMWAGLITKSYLSAQQKGLGNWAGLFLFLGAYWAAFMANTGFDVFIEGPMGGIWLWCLYGAGIGSMWVYKRYPDLLTPPPKLLPPLVR